MTKPHLHNPVIIAALASSIDALQAAPERTSRQVIADLKGQILAALERGIKPDAILATLSEQGIDVRWPTVREYAGLVNARSVPRNSEAAARTRRPSATAAAPRPVPPAPQIPPTEEGRDAAPGA